MTDREKLIALLEEDACPLLMVFGENMGGLADHLIANGYDENAEYGKCTIDRIDPCGNYEPSNCRWVSMAEQNRNKRRENG